MPSWRATSRRPGQSLAYTPPKGVAPIVPSTTDPAKLALYAADGLTAGQPFPGNIIPANLIDPNAVLELNAGTFPKPNFNNGTQYIASIAQPTTFAKTSSASITTSTANTS